MPAVLRSNGWWRATGSRSQGLLLAAGRLGDRWGRRRLFMLGLALFALASAACGLAPNPTVLVCARLAQGAAAALVGPSVLAIIGALYTGEERARAIGVYATVMGVAAVGGQLIGGLLLSADIAGLGWRPIFLVNVPIGLAALVLAPRVIPESRVETPERIDVVGIVLAMVALTAIELPLLEGRQLGWPIWTWLCLAAAPVLLTQFVLRQQALARRGQPPLLDLTLFRARSFSAGMVAQLVFWAGQASYFVVLAIFLQDGRGLSAFRAGLVFTVLAVAYLVASSKAPGLAARHGRRVVAVGALLLAAGHATLLLVTAEVGTAGSVFWLIPGLLLAGTGMGFCITSLTTSVMASADPQRAGAISGALATVQQIGNAIGVAVVGIVFFGALNHGYAHAFELGLAVLTGVLFALAVISFALPGKRSRAAG